MKSLREKAIEHLLRDETAQEIFELGWHNPNNAALVILSNGEFEQRQYSGSPSSIINNGERLGDFGMDGCSYAGDELDYRRAVRVLPEINSLLEKAMKKIKGGIASDTYAHYLDIDDLIDVISGEEMAAMKLYDKKAFWRINGKWCIAGEIVPWRDFQDCHPCEFLIERIQEIEFGFFDDEKN